MGAIHTLIVLVFLAGCSRAPEGTEPHVTAPEAQSIPPSGPTDEWVNNYYSHAMIHLYDDAARPFHDEALAEGLYTEETVETLKLMLVLNDDGLLVHLPVDAYTEGRLGLTPEEIADLNDAMDTINETILNGDFRVEADFDNVAIPLILAAKGFWYCLGKAAECLLHSALCLSELAACTAACASPPCWAGCALCIMAYGPAIGPPCFDAVSCWTEFYDECARCIGGTRHEFPHDEPTGE